MIDYSRSPFEINKKSEQNTKSYISIKKRPSSSMLEKKRSTSDIFN
jgi:hypothetical protein